MYVILNCTAGSTLQDLRKPSDGSLIGLILNWGTKKIGISNN